MKTILISAIAISVIVIAYFFFFDNGDEATRIAKLRKKSLDVKFVSNPALINRNETITNKLSMKQIDSITALINYNFTVQNYGRDVVPANTAEQKNKKL